MKLISLLLRYAAFVFLAVCSFWGCKKSVANTGLGDSYMRFKLNGTKKDYGAASATFLAQTSGVYGVGIAGVNVNDPTNIFSITLYSKTAVSQGAGFTADYVTGTFFPQGTLAYVEGSKGYGSSTTFITPAAKVTVQITELSATYVKGTFSGTLYADNGNFTTVIYAVTEGEFNAKRN